MRIEWKTENKTRFFEIKPGECFTYYNCYYGKTFLCIKTTLGGAIDLEEGKIWSNVDWEVTPVKAYVIIEEE